MPIPVNSDISATLIVRFGRFIDSKEYPFQGDILLSFSEMKLHSQN
jgi:hypothetical protein